MAATRSGASRRAIRAASSSERRRASTKSEAFDRASSGDGAARAERQHHFEADNIPRSKYINDCPSSVWKPTGLISQPGTQLIHVPRQLASFHQSVAGFEISDSTLAKNGGQYLISVAHFCLNVLVRSYLSVPTA